jgi:hypothetical protein
VRILGGNEMRQSVFGEETNQFPGSFLVAEVDPTHDGYSNKLIRVLLAQTDLEIGFRVIEELGLKNI